MADCDWALILSSAGFSFTNPVQMAALSETPLDQRGMLAGIFPLAGNFGTALWVALLTAGMSAFMNQLCRQQSGRDRMPSALSSALSTLAWISLAAMLITLFVAFKLPKSEPVTVTAAVADIASN